MKRAGVLLAAVLLLAGCGTQTSLEASDSDTATKAASTRSASTDASASPSSSAPKPAGKKPAGKGSHDGKVEDQPAADKVPADAPACAAVWRAGSRLARDYDGCMSGKQYLAPDQEPCSFGKQLVRFADHFYAVRGGPVNRTVAPLTKDRQYRGAVASCRA